MVWFCGGHGVCLTGAGEAGHVERAVLNWLARYLKRDTSVQTGPRFEWLADDAQWRSAGDYPLPRRGSLTAVTGQKTLPIAPGSPSGGADRRHARRQRRRGGAARGVRRTRTWSASRR